MKHHAALEAVVARGERGLQQRRRRRVLVAIQLGVTLVGRRSRSRGARRARAPGAGIRATAPRRWDCPGLHRNSTWQRFQTSAGTASRSGWKRLPGGGVEEHGLGAGEQRRAFVDLVERIRHRDHGLASRRSRRTTACTNENSASRVPFTGSTMVSGAMHAAVRSAARARPRRPRAFPAVRRSPDSCRACRGSCRSASMTKAGGACFGSPIDMAMCGRPAGGVTPAFRRASRSKG